MSPESRIVDGRILGGRDTRYQKNKAKRQEERKKLGKEINDYKAALQALPHNELLELYKAEKKKEREEPAMRLMKEEKQRFFYLPSADADFEHWSKAA